MIVLITISVTVVINVALLIVFEYWLHVLYLVNVGRGHKQRTSSKKCRKVKRRDSTKSDQHQDDGFTDSAPSVETVRRHLLVHESES